MRKRLQLVSVLVLATAVVAVPAAVAHGSSSKFQVVAAENFWGSIASQLAGNRANVTSIIVNPDTDPHDYQPAASDARTMAGAKVAIVNGIGYDNWASQLIDANPVGGRVVVDAGDVLGLKQGDNPHQWYSPASVRRVADAIVAAYVKVDPADAGYFAAQKRLLETKGFADYNRLRAEIRHRFAGVPVGYSESIFEPLGASLGLKLLTPPSFARAIAEGSEVSAADRQTVQRQLQKRLIKVWVFNSQNETPEIDQLNKLARAEKVPVATITETLSPANLTFEQWQAAELESLIGALHRATGR